MGEFRMQQESMCMEVPHVHVHVSSASNAEVAHSWNLHCVNRTHEAGPAPPKHEQRSYDLHERQMLVSERREALEQSRAAVLHKHRHTNDAYGTPKRCFRSNISVYVALQRQIRRNSVPLPCFRPLLGTHGACLPP
jgi:hypothetical protein